MLPLLLKYCAFCRSNVIAFVQFSKASLYLFKLNSTFPLVLQLSAAKTSRSMALSRSLNDFSKFLNCNSAKALRLQKAPVCGWSSIALEKSAAASANLPISLNTIPLWKWFHGFGLFCPIAIALLQSTKALLQSLREQQLLALLETYEGFLGSNSMAFVQSFTAFLQSQRLQQAFPRWSKQSGLRASSQIALVYYGRQSQQFLMLQQVLALLKWQIALLPSNSIALSKSARALWKSSTLKQAEPRLLYMLPDLSTLRASEYRSRACLNFPYFLNCSALAYTGFTFSFSSAIYSSILLLISASICPNCPSLSLTSLSTCSLLTQQLPISNTSMHRLISAPVKASVFLTLTNSTTFLTSGLKATLSLSLCKLFVQYSTISLIWPMRISACFVMACRSPRLKSLIVMMLCSRGYRDQQRLVVRRPKWLCSDSQPQSEQCRQMKGLQLHDLSTQNLLAQQWLRGHCGQLSIQSHGYYITTRGNGRDIKGAGVGDGEQTWNTINVQTEGMENRDFMGNQWIHIQILRKQMRNAKYIVTKEMYLMRRKRIKLENFSNKIWVNMAQNSSIYRLPVLNLTLSAIVFVSLIKLFDILF